MHIIHPQTARETRKRWQADLDQVIITPLTLSIFSARFEGLVRETKRCD